MDLVVLVVHHPATRRSSGRHTRELVRCRFRGVGVRVVLADRSSSVQIALLVLATVAIAIATGWMARPSLSSGYALTFGPFGACAGPNTLVLGRDAAPPCGPAGFGALSVIVGLWATQRRDADPTKTALSGSNAYL
jgi:hypothetical protein